ncbi:hypothetical protein BJY01DRAFT_20075 [Aspergillus pseudoustus]|uniref:Uncharacterized protein n=1 Tax=Aspergillus pseudoustus TaxID=1810923 RepID=A0ABR4JKD1_9EURO
MTMSTANLTVYTTALPISTNSINGPNIVCGCWYMVGCLALIIAAGLLLFSGCCRGRVCTYLTLTLPVPRGLLLSQPGDRRSVYTVVWLQSVPL